jgi:hypothetical protein
MSEKDSALYNTISAGCRCEAGQVVVLWNFGVDCSLTIVVFQKAKVYNTFKVCLLLLI